MITGLEKVDLFVADQIDEAVFLGQPGVSSGDIIHN